MKTHTSPSQVAVIDTRVEDYEVLEQAAREAGLEIILLKADGDGIESLATSLEGFDNIDSLHILSHGDTGTLALGNDVLTAQNLHDHAEALSIISESLSEDADLLLYGCNIANGAEGVDFINQLALLSGADIAASNDLTGNSSLDGDWELEIVSGDIESSTPFSERALADFSQVLAFTGTINFSTVTTAGSLGGANTVNAQFGGAGGYTLVLDGADVSTYGGFGRGYSSAGESQITLDFSGGETFTPTSIYIYNISGTADTFTVSSNVGGSVSSGSLNDSSGTTLNISSFGAGVASVYINVLDGSGYFSVDNFAVTNVGPANNAPAISIDNANLAYTEGNAATQIDSAATVSDADGDAEWNGGTLVAQITGNAESGDRISIVDSDGDGTAITVSGTNIFSNGTDIGDLSASGGIVTGGTALTITFDSDATNANVQEVLQSLRYDSTTNDPGTSNRTITLTATDKNTDSNADTRTVSVTAVNDEPTLTATGSNPTFTEGGAAASLFSSANISTVEAGQNITGLSFTITNVTNGSNERLNVDGTTVVLTHGTNGSTAGNSLNYSVMVIGTTATVTMTGGNLSTAAAQTLVDNMSYQNNSNAPSTSNRVITLTSIQDSGGTANGGDNTGSLAVASTVTVVQNNDEPTLTATGSNPTFTEGGAAASLFSGASASTIESGQTLSALTLTITNVNDGSNEILNTDGTAIVLTNGTSGTTASNSLSYSVSVSGTTATVSLTGGTLSTAAAQTLIDNISYQNNSNTPNTSNRVVTITSLTDSGGTANGGDDTAALAIASTVTVVGVNDEPTLTATGSNPTFTEGGAAASLFSSANISTVEAGQNITGLSFTITNVTNGSNERLNVDGTTVVLTHGTNGSTAGNSLNYSVMVIGTTATVTMTGGNLSTAAAQTLVDNMSYQNNSNAPSTSNRVITLTSIQDSGGTANGGDNTGSLAVASTVTVVQNNDEPTLTATGSNPTFTEGGAAAGLFSGASASTIESGQTLSALTLTVTNVNDGSNEILNADGTAIVLTNGTSGTTASNSLSYSVAVAGTTATVSLTGGTLSTAAAQTLIDNISYQNNSNIPSTSNRVVTITSIQDSGGTANGGDDTAALAVTSTVTVIGVNDEPTLTATGSDPTFTEGGAAASLFSSANISTVEAGQNITGLSFTITNVTNGSNERLNVDGTTVVLTHGTNGSTAGNSLNYSVMVIGTTATVTMTGGSLSTAAAQTLVDNMSYQNNSNSPSTSNRVVTLTSIQDSGGTANGGDNTGSLAVASTVTVVQNNDEPTLTATGSNPTFTEGGAAAGLFSGASASTIESGQTLSALTLTVTNVNDGSNEILNADGTAIVLTNGTSGTTASNSLSYSVAVAGTTATVSLTGGTLSTAAAQTLIDNISYQNNSNTPNTSNRVVTITSLTDSGGTANGGDDTAALAINSTVTVVANPTIASATYNVGTGILVVTGTDMQANGGGADIDVSTLTLTGEGGATYTLTDSSDVERDSATQFTVTLSATDKTAANQIVNKNGTSSAGGTIYNLAAADDWNTNLTAGDTADLTANVITVSGVPISTITSAAYDANTGVLIVTGTDFVSAIGAANDVIANKFTFTGEGGATYTLTDTANVDITSATAFTLTLSATDKTAINQIVNKDGASSTDGSIYNLAATEDWAAGENAAVNVADLIANPITVSNVAAPTITAATYNTGTGTLAVTGVNLLKAGGAGNDIIANKFTLTGEGGVTYTLTDTANVDITSATTFTLTLSAVDKAAVNLLVNKNGTASNDATTYNLAAAEDWAAGADAAVNVVDAAGNAITATVAPPNGGGGGGGGSNGSNNTSGSNGNNGGNDDNTTTPDTTAPGTKTFDGVTIDTQTETDGTTTLAIPVVDSTRIDDPNTVSKTHADIPVLTNLSGGAILTVSLPTGVGLSANGQSAPMNAQDAANDLVERITQRTTTDNGTLLEITAQGQRFLSSLASDEQVSVQTILPTVGSDAPPDLPLIISGSNLADDGKLVLVVDMSNMPPGSAIQLDNVAFAAIIGAVRVTGGAGENFAVGDDQDQFIVLGPDDDILFGGGGNDTVGSLGGNDQTNGDAGNDTVYGGAGHDVLTGGSGNDILNGGLGFDTAKQAGKLSDYQIAVNGNRIILNRDDDETDTLTDVELIRFETGPSLAIAYSVAEAVAHHLVKTWLGRDLTATEGNAVQNWVGATSDDIVTAFLNLPEAAEFNNQSTDELLAGLNENPNVIQVNTARTIVGSNQNDQGYLTQGLGFLVDGGSGHDVLRMRGSRDDVYLEQVDSTVEITRLNDGAMLSLTNAEMIAFDSGENQLLAHNRVEGILGRLVQTFFDRDATIDEWQMGRDALNHGVSPDVILNWFQTHANSSTLNDTDYIQTLYNQTYGRFATETELNQQLLRLDNGEVTREWLAVDIASSDEAITTIGSVWVVDSSV